MYISPLFPQSVTRSNTEATFDQILSQSDIRHDYVECSDGDDENLIASMRQHAIRISRESGNAIVTLNWKQLRSLLPDAKSAANGEIYASSGRSSTPRSGWQYCLAASHTERKVYLSLLFPKRATLSDDAEAAFNQMLLRSDIRHDSAQCPKRDDEYSLSSMRQHAISFNNEAGNAIIAVNWKP
jgi:hypothetical protein